MVVQENQTSLSARLTITGYKLEASITTHTLCLSVPPSLFPWTVFPSFRKKSYFSNIAMLMCDKILGITSQVQFQGFHLLENITICYNDLYLSAFERRLRLLWQRAQRNVHEAPGPRCSWTLCDVLLDLTKCCNSAFLVVVIYRLTNT